MWKTWTHKCTILHTIYLTIYDHNKITRYQTIASLSIALEFTVCVCLFLLLPFFKTELMQSNLFSHSLCDVAHYVNDVLILTINKSRSLKYGVYSDADKEVAYFLCTYERDNDHYILMYVKYIIVWTVLTSLTT